MSSFFMLSILESTLISLFEYILLTYVFTVMQPTHICTADDLQNVWQIFKMGEWVLENKTEILCSLCQIIVKQILPSIGHLLQYSSGK